MKTGSYEYSLRKANEVVSAANRKTYTKNPDCQVKENCLKWVFIGSKNLILNKFKAIKKDFCGWPPSIFFSLGYSVWKDSSIGTIFYRDEGKNNFDGATQQCEDANEEFKAWIFDRYLV